jgi:hypothetical protein
MKSKLVKLVFMILFMLIFSNTIAYAHKPIFEKSNTTLDTPIVVPDHKISYAIYGELKTRKDVDFAKFKAVQGDTFFVQISVPIIKSNEDFKPSIAIIGEGILERSEVPFEVPPELGIIVLSPGPSELFYEKFTQTSYYLNQSIRGEIPKSGDYYVAVFSKEIGGKYTLIIGEDDKFSLIDLVKFPLDYLRVKYFFNPLTTIIISIGVILMLSAIVRIIKLRR